MHLRPPPQRWALWAFALALLLKAAVPLLATASAHAQGKTLVEVCTVYGVATVALEGHGSTPQPDHAVPHGGEHCALSAVVALCAPPAVSAALPMARAPGPPERAQADPSRHDAAAAWVARRKQGPPFLA